MPVAPQKHPHNYRDIFTIRAFFRKYLNGKCCSEPNPQLSFKYFVTSCLNSKLFSKVSKVQTTIVKASSRHEWVKTRIYIVLKMLVMK